MSRDLSDPVLAAIYARETDEVELQLLTIDHDDMSAPVRLVNDHADIVSRSNTYTSHKFELPVMSDEEGRLPRVELAVDNVSLLLVETIRSIATPIQVKFELVFASDPDTVIAGPWDFEMREVRYNQFTLRASLQFEPLIDEPYPTPRFTPTDFPGLFNAVAS